MNVVAYCVFELCAGIIRTLQARPENKWFKHYYYGIE